MVLFYKNTQVHFEVFGKSNQKTLFFLHGWGCDGSVFEHLAKSYQNFFKCVVVTFPPFGKSHTPKDVWNIDDYTNILNQIIKALKIKYLAIISHSFGTRVAINFANCYNNLKALIITGGAGLKPRRGPRYHIKVLFYKAFKRFLNAKKVGSEDFRNLTGNMRKTFINIVNNNQKQQAKKISVPTLLIYGRQDKQTKLYMAKKFNKLIKTSVLKIYNNTGHFAFLEKPELFFSDTFQFLKKHY